MQLAPGKSGLVSLLKFSGPVQRVPLLMPYSQKIGVQKYKFFLSSKKYRYNFWYICLSTG